MKKYETNILLLSVIFCWAAAYVFIETLTELVSPFAYLTMMNGVAAVTLLIIFLPKVLRTTRRELLHGVLLGLIMTGVLLAEYTGVDVTSSSTASLLASMDLVVVPLLLLFLGRIPRKNQIAGIFLILCGTVLTRGLPGSGDRAAGIFFMALDGVLMAFYNVISNRFCREDDPIRLAVLQLVIMTLFPLILWYRADPRVFLGVPPVPELVISVLFLGFFSKAFAYVALMYGERYAHPIDVVVIFALEPVVTMLFAAVFPDEFGGSETAITVKGLICAVLIVSGSMIAGLEEGDLKILTGYFRRKKPAVPETGGETGTVPELPGGPHTAPGGEGGDGAGTAEKDAPRLAWIWTRGRSFLTVFSCFLVFGICFKLTVLIANYTEIRPVNSLPVPAGLLFGIPAAAACALGNLAADMFATLMPSSILGMLVNFLQAFLPFRLWNLYGEGRPNVHTPRNLFTYVLFTFASAVTAAWILGFGISFFFGGWIPKLAEYVFVNNLLFPLIFGLPVFIILTSPDVNTIPVPALPWILPVSGSVRKGLFSAYLLIVGGISAAVWLGITPETAGNAPFFAASVPAVLLLAVVLL